MVHPQPVFAPRSRTALWGPPCHRLEHCGEPGLIGLDFQVGRRAPEPTFRGRSTSPSGVSERASHGIQKIPVWIHAIFTPPRSVNYCGYDVLGYPLGSDDQGRWNKARSPQTLCWRASSASLLAETHPAPRFVLSPGLSTTESRASHLFYPVASASA